MVDVKTPVVTGVPDNTCRACGSTFKRSKACVWPFLISDAQCFDCFMIASVGVRCDAVVAPPTFTTLRVAGRPERYTIAARQAPNKYWYLRTVDRDIVVVDEPVEFRSVMSSDLPERVKHIHAAGASFKQ